MEGSGVTATERSDRPLPPRRRPRLKPFRIVCALPECGRTVVRYYPRRPTVAAKANPGGRTYCSKSHSTRDWERRRRHASAETTPCAWRGCTNQIPPTHRPGRPRSYCSDRCKELARSERSRPVPNALATAQAREATAREKAAPARREADTFRARLAATEAAGEAAAQYPARLRDWEQAEPKPPGPPAPPPVHPRLRMAWMGRHDSRPPSEIQEEADADTARWQAGERLRIAAVARYEAAVLEWQASKPTPPRERSLRGAALREALPGLRSQLADLEAAAVVVEHDVEQAAAAVEHVRKRLAKRAADAKARRADAKALSDVDQDVEVKTLEEFEAREPQPRPESSYTPTAWDSAHADMDPERERFYAENPDGRR